MGALGEKQSAQNIFPQICARKVYLFPHIFLPGLVGMYNSDIPCIDVFDSLMLIH